MKNITQNIKNLLFPSTFVYDSPSDATHITVGQKKTLKILEKYDKGQVDIDYSAELKKLEEFTRTNP
ncbi:MAG: hypothetical protein H6774_01010 [Pseudomonadales bacterium]|nr:hypothetical protein [Candidatus Woesebacteria bacterium]MCB9801646.1 hypothetical protein [Pseudomonadales bacterium]